MTFSNDDAHRRAAENAIRGQLMHKYLEQLITEREQKQTEQQKKEKKDNGK